MAHQRVGYVQDFSTAHHLLVEQGVHPLKAARILRNLSVVGLAAASGVSARTIFYAEAGTHIGSFSRHRLSAYFGMEAYALGLI